MRCSPFKAALLALLLLIPVARTASANEMQWELLNASMNLGWAVAAIELGGITPDSQQAIATYLTNATLFIANAEGFLYGPYSDLGLIDVNPDLERFWVYTADWPLDHRARYVASVYDRLRHKVSYIFNSQRGLIQRANCDTAYLEVGYHFGRANIAAFLGNESYRVSAHGSMKRSINNGLQAARDLACEFGTLSEWEALPFRAPYTAAVYTAALPPLLDIPFSAGGGGASGFNYVRQPDFATFGQAGGPWGTGQYAEKGVWWRSGNAQATARSIALASDDALVQRYNIRTALMITNNTPLAPHVFATTSQRIELSPGREYQVSLWAAARNLASDGAVFIVVDPGWVVRPINIGKGTYDWKRYTGTFRADRAGYIDLRIVSADVGTVWLTGVKVTSR